MASPDRIKKVHVLAGMVDGVSHTPLASTMTQTIIRMMTVRIRVAKSELMLATPILAKIAVRAAKHAASAAQSCQLLISSFI